jgi:hypothetical protein
MPLERVVPTVQNLVEHLSDLVDSDHVALFQVDYWTPGSMVGFQIAKVELTLRQTNLRVLVHFVEVVVLLN